MPSMTMERPHTDQNDEQVTSTPWDMLSDEAPQSSQDTLDADNPDDKAEQADDSSVDKEQSQETEHEKLEKGVGREAIEAVDKEFARLEHQAVEYDKRLKHYLECLKQSDQGEAIFDQAMRQYKAETGKDFLQDYDSVTDKNAISSRIDSIAKELNDDGSPKYSAESVEFAKRMDWYANLANGWEGSPLSQSPLPKRDFLGLAVKSQFRDEASIAYQVRETSLAEADNLKENGGTLDSMARSALGRKARRDFEAAHPGDPLQDALKAVRQSESEENPPRKLGIASGLKQWFSGFGSRVDRGGESREMEVDNGAYGGNQFANRAVEPSTKELKQPTTLPEQQADELVADNPGVQTEQVTGQLTQPSESQPEQNANKQPEQPTPVEQPEPTADKSFKRRVDEQKTPFRGFGQVAAENETQRKVAEFREAERAREQEEWRQFEQLQKEERQQQTNKLEQPVSAEQSEQKPDQIQNKTDSAELPYDPFDVSNDPAFSPLIRNEADDVSRLNESIPSAGGDSKGASNSDRDKLFSPAELHAESVAHTAETREQRSDKSEQSESDEYDKKLAGMAKEADEAKAGKAPRPAWMAMDEGRNQAGLSERETSQEKGEICRRKLGIVSRLTRRIRRARRSFNAWRARSERQLDQNPVQVSGAQIDQNISHQLEEQYNAKYQEADAKLKTFVPAADLVKDYLKQWDNAGSDIGMLRQRNEHALDDKNSKYDDVAEYVNEKYKDAIKNGNADQARELRTALDIVKAAKEVAGNRVDGDLNKILERRQREGRRDINEIRFRGKDAVVSITDADPVDLAAQILLTDTAEKANAELSHRRPEQPAEASEQPRVSPNEQYMAPPVDNDHTVVVDSSNLPPVPSQVDDEEETKTNPEMSVSNNDDGKNLNNDQDDNQDQEEKVETRGEKLSNKEMAHEVRDAERSITKAINDWRLQQGNDLGRAVSAEEFGSTLGSAAVLFDAPVDGPIELNDAGFDALYDYLSRLSTDSEPKLEDFVQHYNSQSGESSRGRHAA